MQILIIDEQYNEKKDSCRMRRAVRAVVYQHDVILMIYSNKNGDYKFPGGGIEKGENEEEALRREVKEETGYDISVIGEKIICACEYRKYDDDEFVMESNYYVCSINDGQGHQNLDDYEKDLGFVPVIVSAEEACRANISLLGTGNEPAWTKREVLVLEKLIEANPQMTQIAQIVGKCIKHTCLPETLIN
ncbi:MAG TPA: NUDIX domain-containing protein [Treponemataceae bacterium]|nr:NUDIX domain-containing protein [Treponemataceae bacterium]